MECQRCHGTGFIDVYLRSIDAIAPMECRDCELRVTKNERPLVMLSLRCSSLPRIAACAASVVPPALRIESPREPADLGSAFHACAAKIVKGEHVDTDIVAAEFNVEPRELYPMVGWFGWIWRERLSAMMPEPLVEEPMETTFEGLRLTGTVDLMSIVEELLIVDYKSGWGNYDARDQLKGYAFLGMAVTGLDVVRATILRVREQRAETFEWSRDELTAWWGWLASHVKQETYRPGAHCGRCPRALECPAHALMIRNAAAIMLDIKDRDIDQFQRALQTLSPEQLSQAVEQARMIGKFTESFVGHVKAHVEARGGQVGRLELIESPRRTIDTARAWDIACEEIGELEFRNTLKVVKEDFDSAIKESAPRGQKGKRVAAVMERLDQAGAVTHTTVKRLEVRHGDSNAAAAISTGDNANASPGESPARPKASDGPA